MSVFAQPAPKADVNASCFSNIKSCMLGMKKIDIAGIESPSRMTRRTLRLAHGCAKKPSRHRARQALALR
jgi:hypothetical protein